MFKYPLCHITNTRKTFIILYSFNLPIHDICAAINCKGQNNKYIFILNN